MAKDLFATDTGSSGPRDLFGDAPVERQPRQLGNSREEQELFAVAQQARDAGDENAARRAMAEIAGLRQGAGEDRGEAALRGFGQGVFGVGDFAAAAGGTVGSALRGEDFGFRERLAFERGRRRAMQQENPLSSGAGFAAGAVSSGGGVANVAGRGAQAAGAGRVANLLSPAARTTTAGRVASTAGQGAVAGGAAGFIESGGDLGEARNAAAAGAAGGAVFDALARPAGFLTRALRRRFSPERAADRTLSSRVDVDSLETRADDFQQTTGRAPTVAELLDEDEATELSDVLGVGRAGPRIMRDAEEAGNLARASNLRGTIQNNRGRTSPAALNRRASQEFSEFMQKNKSQMVDFDDDGIALILSPEVREVMPPRLRRAIARGVEMDEETGEILSVNLDLDTVDAVRQELGNAARRGMSAAPLGGLRDELTEIAGDQVPGFEKAVDDFAALQRTREGFESGGGVRSTRNTQQFVDEASFADDETATGIRRGARQALSETAAAGPEDAARLARDLAQDEGLAQRVTASMGPQEAERLRALGNAELQAARAMATATPQLRSLQQETRETVSAAITGIVLAGGRASGALQANFARNVLGLVNGDRARAAALARAVTDPDQTGRVISRLQQLGATETQIQQLYSDLSRAASIASGQAASDEVQ